VLADCGCVQDRSPLLRGHLARRALSREYDCVLKDIFKGAATLGITQRSKSPLSPRYERMRADGTRVAFLECVDCGTTPAIPPGQGVARRLIVADLDGAGGIDVLDEVEIGDAILGPTWSPDGRWITYATVATGEIFVVPVEDLSAEPLQVTQGADVCRTLAGYVPVVRMRSWVSSVEKSWRSTRPPQQSRRA